MIRVSLVKPFGARLRHWWRVSPQIGRTKIFDENLVFVVVAESLAKPNGIIVFAIFSVTAKTLRLPPAARRIASGLPDFERSSV